MACHEVERFENLMYEGCESHWHCIHCDDYWPFHCYGKKDLEQMECPARKQNLAFADKDTAYYEAYVYGTDIKAEFELPKNASIYEKRFEAKESILRMLDIRFKKKKVKSANNEDGRKKDE